MRLIRPYSGVVRKRKLRVAVLASAIIAVVIVAGCQAGMSAAGRAPGASSVGGAGSPGPTGAGRPGNAGPGQPGNAAPGLSGNAAPGPNASAAPGLSGTLAPGPAGLPGAGADSGDITLEFAGDVHFTGRTAALLKSPTTAFGGISTVLSAADVTAVNLETAVTGRGTPQPKTFHFRAPPTAFDAVRGAGIDLVTLANNHMLDYGRVGLADTLAAARAASFPTIGAGADADAAWAPWIITVRGTRIAYLGVSDVQELASSWIATPTRSGVAIANNLSRTLAAVRAASKHADVVIVFMHWGTEGDSCPDPSQKTLAAKLAAAGANIIIGSHVHTLQASGWLGNTFVAYGMGNFLWWRASWSDQTGVLRLVLRPGAHVPYQAQLIPAVVSPNGQPVLAKGKTKTEILRRYASLRRCAGLSASASSASAG